MSKPRTKSAHVPALAQPSSRGLGRVLMLATVFTTGACVLVVEIAGARVVSPLYGSGLYSWSALISVTLAALSLGYWTGGRAADRRPEPGLFHGGILLAGLLVAAIPWVAGTVLRMTEPLDPRLGVLLSAMLLFFPPLTLLGGVTPFAIRLAQPPAGEVGGVSGLVFAVSTVGSLLAALATGFVLIPNLGVRTILALTGTALALIAAAGFWGTRRPAAGTLAVLLAIASLFAWRGGSAGEPTEGLRIVERRPSFFGFLRVVETRLYRMLTVNGIGQNYLRLDGGGVATPYLGFLAALPHLRRAPADARTGLLIGLGAGELVSMLGAEGVDLTVVELDPHIEALARRHFGLRLPHERIHIADGRAFLERDHAKYDFLFMDAFLGEDVPGHLYTREAITAMRDRLAPGGLLAMNYTTIPNGEDVRAVAHTLQAVFPHVRTFTDGSAVTELASLVLLASTDPIVLEHDPALANAELFLTHETRVETARSRILTDDFNPIQTWRLGATRQWRQAMIRHIGEDWAYWADF